jgi:hypothetical protein
VARRIIVVVGMHRSGTSALARGLAALGASLGDRLKPAVADDNDKGFWEDIDLSRINDELFASVGRHWHSMDLASACSALAGAPRALRTAAIRTLADRLGRHRTFIFKDPRTALLLPFWQRIFAALKLADAYVICFRNPLSVARSLAHRDGFPRIKSYHLWLMHALAAIEHTERKCRVFVEFDDLITDPLQQLSRVQRAIGDGVLRVLKDEANSYAQDFLEPRLRHQMASPAELASDPDCLPLVLEVYTRLRRETRRAPGVPGSSKGSWEPLLRRFQEVSAYGRYLEAQSAHGELARVLHARAEENANSAREIAALNERAGVAEEYARALRSELSGLHESNEAERAAWNRERAETATHVTDLTRRANELETYAKSLAVEIDSLRQTHESDHEMWAARQAAMQQQAAALEERARAAEAYAASLAESLENMRQSYAAERATWTEKQAGTDQQAAALEERARAAEAYAASLAESLENMRQSYAAERATWASQREAIAAHVAGLEKSVRRSEDFARSLEGSLARMRESHEAERMHWTKERAEAEVGAEALASELANLRKNHEQERAGWRKEREACRARVIALGGELAAFRQHWPYRFLKHPKGSSSG